jgi:hypothetical protein
MVVMGITKMFAIIIVIHAAIGVVIVSGCTSTAADIRTPQADVAFELAMATLDIREAPSPTPCVQCNGTGKTGDGLADCGMCDGTGRLKATADGPVPLTVEEFEKLQEFLRKYAEWKVARGECGGTGVAADAHRLALPPALPARVSSGDHEAGQLDDETFDTSRNIYWRRDDGPRREAEYHWPPWGLYWRLPAKATAATVKRSPIGSGRRFFRGGT